MLFRRLTWWWLSLAGAGFIVLSVLVATGRTVGFDQAARAPALNPQGWPAQLWLVIAVVSHPYVIILAGLVLAIRLARQRLIRLAVAMVSAVIAGPALQLGLKYVFQRPRPVSTMSWVIGSGGFAFPSGHATAITIFAILAVRTRLLLRQGAVRVWVTRVSGTAAIVVVALDRWALSAHWLTDLIGGVLFGGFIAGLALALVDRVDSPRRQRVAPVAGDDARGGGTGDLGNDPTSGGTGGTTVGPGGDATGGLVGGTARDATGNGVGDLGGGGTVRPTGGATTAVLAVSGDVADKTAPTAAVIYNPAKIGSIDLFRRQVSATLADAGWAEPLWYETTAKQAGQSQALAALDTGADLVIASGGDGTITAVIQALAHRDVPLAILPSGTANLLARNLGVPMDEPAALAIALNGRPRAVDLVRITTDAWDGYSASISGVGIDAKVMADTTNDLKRWWGNAAYAWSILGNLNGQPRDFQLTIDDGPPIDRRAVSILIGNIGLLQVPLALFPRASFDDGIFDILVATPSNLADWTAIGSRVLAGKPSQLDLGSRHPDEPLEYAQARRLEVTVDPPTSFEIDGDPLGSTSRLVAEIQPEALLVMGPPVG